MRRILYIITVTLLLFTQLSCEDSKKETIQPNVETEIVEVNKFQITNLQFEKNTMVLGGLEERNFTLGIQAKGTIDVPPSNRTVVNALMGGYIKETKLLVGDKVKKGQVLVVIENLEFVSLQQEYLEVKEQLTYLKSEYDRQKTMFEEKITSSKNFLKAESLYKTAKAKYGGLHKRLLMLNISPKKVGEGVFTSTVKIYAPLSGYITKISVTKGTYVSPAATIIEIIDESHIHLELSVFEKDIMKLKKGQKIKFKIPEASMDFFDAEVHLIGTSIEKNRTIKVHAHLEDEGSYRFIVGMYVDALILTKNISAMALPAEAIVTVDNRDYVLLLVSKENENYSFKKVQVKTGSFNDGFTEILNVDKFGENDQFLIKGAFNLLGE
ncbi:MAG: efflux RND transporter periplasmic adaptor subunit [Flavobacteriaceae bacterium]|nr:efflux RND transporter periplasmic adaptor subunit [Flavobacteriaceae bacterium]